MVCGAPAISRANERFGVIKRIASKIARQVLGLIYGHDLKRGPAAIKHREARPAPDFLHDLRQGGAELFGVNRRIHTKLILS